jgi:hypothetical protein
MFLVNPIVKKINVVKRATFCSVKIWDRPNQKTPRVRIASIDKRTGNAPYLDTILREEEDIRDSASFSDVVTTRETIKYD